MRNIVILMLCVFPVLVWGGKVRRQGMADTQTTQWRYEIEPVSVGTQGSAVVKVWSYLKDPKIAREQCKKNAVHGVIFKGIPSKERIPGKKPLVTAAEASQHADFFDKFFAAGGDYMKFVALTNTGAGGGESVLKVSKKEYKVGVTVTVNYNNLRSYLEGKGIIKKLDAGF